MMGDPANPQSADPVADLRAAVAAAVSSLAEGTMDSSAPPVFERPPQPEFGDYSTNAAMLLAPTLQQKPRDVAEQLADELRGTLGAAVERVEVAGPGFLNLFLGESWYLAAASALAATGDQLGRPPPPLPAERLLIEFVSANPTGPVTAAGGRHAAYGDAVARLVEFVGHQVEREYYLNDVGAQVDRFAASIGARMRGEEPSEDGYQGDYVGELAERLAADGVDPDDLESLGRQGTELMATSARQTLERYGIEFDSWFSERSLHERGLLDAVLASLREAGHAYTSEGAVWLRTSEFGDDKDRVLVRSDGDPTYYLADVAYHRDKIDRGFDRLIDVLGSDHHGYVARLKAVLAALGVDPSRLEILIMQLVHVVERGERAQMSKRRGEFVTLDELIDDIGADAARFFMLAHSHDTAVDLDLDLARQTSNDNPVYYVQYAHARISSILLKAEAEAAARPDSAGAEEGTARLVPAERELIKRVCELPAEVAEAASRRAPHRLCAYGTSLAADFHGFYRDCQVVGAPPGVEERRLELCLITKRAIARTLSLLGISAPDRM